MTPAPVVPGVDFKKCGLRQGRFEGSARDDYFIGEVACHLTGQSSGRPNRLALRLRKRRAGLGSPLIASVRL
jgi:hypothetical protein